jgi:hypothetical protein
MKIKYALVSHEKERELKEKGNKIEGRQKRTKYSKRKIFIKGREIHIKR